MESRESSSPIVTRAVAAGLRGRYSDAYHFPWYQRGLLRLLGALPMSVAQWLIPRVQRTAALSLTEMESVSTDMLCQHRLEDYSGLDEVFPAVVMGVAMGGSAAHLCLSVGAPFLPQAFVLTGKGGSPDGSVKTYFERSHRVALSITGQNPELFSIQHFDPVHDGWLTRSVNHLRLKLIRMPKAYKEYVLKHLRPGGDVIFLDGQASWLRYRVGERNVFQVGGWGDISAEEFISGSERLDAYRKTVGMMGSQWELDGYPLERGPESEWGSESGLASDVERFCLENGFRFLRIAKENPNDFARLAFLAVAQQLKLEGRQPAGVVVEMFSQFDATAVFRGSLLPLWLIFNTRDSLRFLKSMRGQFPEGGSVFFSPLATFSQTPDMAAFDEWEEALRDLDWINIGTRKSHYPADARALLDWSLPLRRWVKDHETVIHRQLSGEELYQLACKMEPL